MYIGDTFARQINGKGLRLFADIDVEAFWQVTGKEIYCARYLLTDSLKRRHVVHKSGADGAAMAWARAGWGGVAPAPRRSLLSVPSTPAIGVIRFRRRRAIAPIVLIPPA